MHLRQGDMLTLLLTEAEDNYQDWISLENHSTGESIAISTPGQRLTAKVRAYAGTVFFGGLLLPALAFDLDWFKSGLIAAALTGLYVYGYRRLKSPKRSTSKQALQVNADMHALLLKKAALLDKRYQLQKEAGQRTNVRMRLQGTLDKMQHVDSALYASRIERLQTALSDLDQLHRREDHLLENYDKMLTMLDIEIESLDLDPSSSPGMTAALDTRFHDLESMENLDRELRLHLEAHEEIAALLKQRA